jgi:hypothetical protein
MVVQQFEIAATVPVWIFQLLTNLTLRFPLPSHAQRRHIPARVTGDALVGDSLNQPVVFLGMTGLAGANPSEDRWHVGMHIISLRRSVPRGMAINAARIGEDFGNFGKQRTRSSLLVGDVGE